MASACVRRSSDLSRSGRASETSATVATIRRRVHRRRHHFCHGHGSAFHLHLRLRDVRKPPGGVVVRASLPSCQRRRGYVVKKNVFSAPKTDEIRTTDTMANTPLSLFMRIKYYYEVLRTSFYHVFHIVVTFSEKYGI